MMTMSLTSFHVSCYFFRMVSFRGQIRLESRPGCCLLGLFNPSSSSPSLAILTSSWVSVISNLLYKIKPLVLGVLKGFKVHATIKSVL